MGLLWGGAKPAPKRAESRVNVPWPLHLLTGTDRYNDVSLNTAEASLQSIAVRSAADLIASLASELPVHVYTGEGADRRKLPTPGYLQDPAGDGNGLPDWAYQVLMSWMLRGNLYGDVLDRAAGGYITQATLHHPDEVNGWIDPDDGTVHWSVNGRPVTDLNRFLHRRVNPMPGRVQGMSVIGFHAAQIGLTLTATRFGLQWFRDGAHPSGMLVNSEADLNTGQIAAAKERFMAALHGTREPVVMGKGWEFRNLQVSAEESQFLATQGYTEAQCARMFGPGVPEVLGYETGGSMTYANVVDRDLHLLKYSLNKWLRRLERLYALMLPATRYARIDRDAQLQSTTLDRYRAHESALRNRWKTVNEVRTDEDMAAVDWGDEPNSPMPNTEPAPAKDGP